MNKKTFVFILFLLIALLIVLCIATTVIFKNVEIKALYSLIDDLEFQKNVWKGKAIYFQKLANSLYVERIVFDAVTWK